MHPAYYRLTKPAQVSHTGPFSGNVLEILKLKSSMFMFGNYKPHHETRYSILPNNCNGTQLDDQIDESHFAAINENLSNRMLKLPRHLYCLSVTSDLTLRPYPHIDHNREAEQITTKSSGKAINAIEESVFNLPSSLYLQERLEYTKTLSSISDMAIHLGR